MIQHETHFSVRYAETDQMKFVHHSNYIVWFDMGRIGLMESAGISYAGLEKQGFLLPVLEVGARYLKPARFGDELTIITIIPQIPRAKIKFEYQIYNDKEELLCSGFSLHSFMNRNDRAIKPPKEFLQKFKEYF